MFFGMSSIPYRATVITTNPRPASRAALFSDRPPPKVYRSNTAGYGPGPGDRKYTRRHTESKSEDVNVPC